MFSRLPESKPQRQRRAGGAIVSTTLHLVFIALAVRATGLKAEIAPDITPVEPPVYVERREPEPNPEPMTRQPRSASASASSAPVPPTPIVPEVTVILPGIPEPGLPLDLGAWERRSEFRAGVATPGNTSGGSPNGTGATPFTEATVEKAILAIPGTSNPRYPSMLQTAGVEGDVRAQFVVDTLGRVESGSVQVLDATHDLFGSAVREALKRARFTPAEAGGRKVRQLAEQVFTFRITR